MAVYNMFRRAALVAGCLLALTGQARADLMKPGVVVIPPQAYIYLVTGASRPAHTKDCNDYAAENYRFLKARGLEPHYAAAYTERDEGHMVVVVNIRGETVVYDSRTKHPMPWRALPYTWYGVEGPGYIWHAVANANK